MVNMLNVALQISQDLGFPVFPCREYLDQKKGKVSKAPYTRHGFQDASIDREQIKQWWESLLARSQTPS